MSFIEYWVRLAGISNCSRPAIQIERVLWIVHEKSVQRSLQELDVSMFNFAVRRNKQYGHVPNRDTKEVGEFPERGSQEKASCKRFKTEGMF